MASELKGWFVAGTDTGVGKTTVAAALLRKFAREGVSARGIKPVASGCERTTEGLRCDDAEMLAAASVSGTFARDIVCYAFESGIAPHLAAAEAGVEIHLAPIRARCHELARDVDRVVVEGVGGLLAPLGPGLDASEIPRVLGLPVLLVVGMRLGCLNHALLTAEAIERRGLRFGGWVAHVLDPGMPRLDANIAWLERSLPAPRVAIQEALPTALDSSVATRT